MSRLIETPGSTSNEDGPPGPMSKEQERRQVLKRLGRFASIGAPVVVMILAADGKSRRAMAAS
jgi:hypothetical protein